MCSTAVVTIICCVYLLCVRVCHFYVNSFSGLLGGRDVVAVADSFLEFLEFLLSLWSNTTRTTTCSTSFCINKNSSWLWTSLSCSRCRPYVFAVSLVRKTGSRDQHIEIGIIYIAKRVLTMIFHRKLTVWLNGTRWWSPLSHLLCALLRHNKSLCCDPPRKSSRNIVLSPQKRSISFPASDPCVQHMDDIWLAFFYCRCFVDLQLRHVMAWKYLFIFHIFFIYSVQRETQNWRSSQRSWKQIFEPFFCCLLTRTRLWFWENFQYFFLCAHKKAFGHTHKKSRNAKLHFSVSMLLDESSQLSIMIVACTTVE